jgi:hypothetical protein
LDQAEETKEETDEAKALSKVKKIVCRLCKGDHFTSKCPYKETLEGIGMNGSFLLLPPRFPRFSFSLASSASPVQVANLTTLLCWWFADTPQDNGSDPTPAEAAAPSGGSKYVPPYVPFFPADQFFVSDC